MNISLNELKFLVPRVALYSAASYVGVRLARLGMNQASLLLVGSPKSSKENETNKTV